MQAIAKFLAPLFIGAALAVSAHRQEALDQTMNVPLARGLAVPDADDPRGPDAAQLTSDDRQAMREATARWWIVAVSKLGLSLVERQVVGDRPNTKIAWSQIVYAVPEDGTGKSMMQTSYDCLKGTYKTVRRIDFDSDGRKLADWRPELREQTPAPSTFGEASLEYALLRRR